MGGVEQEIAFFIDNNQGKEFFKNRRVLSPMEIMGRDDVYIVVATYEYQWDIYKQLDEYGFRLEEDYGHCDMVTKDYIGLLEQVCFAEAKYPYFCSRPFGYCDVIEPELFLCCPDLLPNFGGKCPVRNIQKML